jgi:predicted GIY-YIG superfamily endonuclease
MFIYALIFNEEIVYVGKTFDPDRRYKDHLKSIISLDKPRKQNIHDYLLKETARDIVKEVLYKSVKIKILKSDLSEEEAETCERFFILDYVDKNYNLQNNCDWYWFCRSNLSREKKMEYIKSSSKEIKSFLTDNNGTYTEIDPLW